MRGADRLTCFPTIILLGLAVLAAAPPASAQDDATLEEYIEQTGEIVAWADEQVRESESTRARQVLDEARHLHLQSQQLQHGGQGRAAFATSRRARTAAQQAVKIAREALGLQERARVRLDRYADFRDQILDRAREADDDRVLRFVHESEQQALRARDQFGQGNFEMALQLIEPAEDLLGRAARLLFEGSGAERLEREVERTRTLIDRTAERIDSGTSVGVETARDLLESAREALRHAEEFQLREQPLRALHSLELARKLAGQAASATGDRIDPETVADEIARWDDRQAAVADAVDAAESPQAEAALARARHHRDRAGRLQGSGDCAQALRQIKAAFDLLNEASELTR
ncbi:MAG TPA: hypothetical protein PLL30_10830 [Candidatus Krumholzibacteria bacterium]|nr:hypothetical protein [Candidatus Krumholzibacteria bacterium]HPD72258.1 hypothetical protein [Candidatus Krumholzibacteria bacterium]HRY40810.1 hypothetical protein [Candidatus Krumholzibacteria bacterium]